MRILAIYLLALSALLAGIWFGFPRLLGVEAAGPDLTVAPPSPPVIVAPVQLAPFAESLEALGTVRANESVRITANRMDHVTEIHFDDGDTVTAGQLLVVLNDAEEQAEKAEAQAQLQELETALRRTQQLNEREIASQDELDAATARVAASQARLARLEAAIAERRVRAPFAGTLGLRQISLGALAQPTTIITTLDDLATVLVDFTIPEAWLPRVQPGQQILATSTTWRESVFVGEVETLDSRVDEQTRSATVRARVPNLEAKLRPGMLLLIEVGAEKRQVLQVPEAAIFPKGEQQYVWRLGQGDIAHETPVTIGRRRVGAVEILEGLQADDRVVVRGLVRVKDGQPVTVVANGASVE